MEEAAHRGLKSYQSFLGRTLIQGLYICEDSQTTASRSATTGGCPPMLKLFMIGNQNQNQAEASEAEAKEARAAADKCEAELISAVAAPPPGRARPAACWSPSFFFIWV